jgi:hypothetical protein
VRLVGLLLTPVIAAMGGLESQKPGADPDRYGGFPSGFIHRDVVRLT